LQRKKLQPFRAVSAAPGGPYLPAIGNRPRKPAGKVGVFRKVGRPAFLTVFPGKNYNAPQVAAVAAAGEDGQTGPVPTHGESEALVPVQMELKRIIISEVHDQQVIMLKEVEGDRSFPIVIGIFEATSIDRRVKGMASPRPLTHDLVASVIEHMGGDLQDIFISELRDHTYFAKLRIRHSGELIEVDSRPSDAIALAVTAKVPIYVAEDVLGEVCGE
jgi:bifunctional DNase/RNase